LSHLTYTANHLVEQPTPKIFAHGGWQVINARDEVLGPGGTLGRESNVDVGE